jgi:plasmid stabilization system protein ParE
MKRHAIKLSNDALADIEQLEYIIVVQYKAPLTAVRYIQGLKDTIKLLAIYPEAYPFNNSTLLNKYGLFSRRTVFKQIRIIFLVFKGTVYIHRIIPSNSIL